MKRKELLKNLVQLNNHKEAYQELKNFSWDCDEPLYLITVTELRESISSFVKTNSFEELENWANMIEGREDLDFETDEAKIFIEKLANPELYGSVEKIVMDLL